MIFLHAEWDDESEIGPGFGESIAINVPPGVGEYDFRAGIPLMIVELIELGDKFVALLLGVLGGDLMQST